MIPQIVGINSVRHGHRMRGKPVGLASTLQQRLASMYFVCRLQLHLGYVHTSNVTQNIDRLQEHSSNKFINEYICQLQN